MIDKTLFNEISELADDTIPQVFFAIVEEVGELSTALHVLDGSKNRVLKEPAENEVVDIILTAIEMYIRLGGKWENLSKISGEKMAKWKTGVLEKRYRLKGGNVG
jgi:hypothetical protein